MRKLTTEQFIELAKHWHNGKYNLSKVIYIKNNIKIEIIFLIHPAKNIPYDKLYENTIDRENTI